MSLARAGFWLVLGALSAACGNDAESHATSTSSGGSHSAPCPGCARAGEAGADSGASNSMAGASGSAAASGSAGASGAAAIGGDAGASEEGGESGAAGDTGSTSPPDGVEISEVSFWQTMRVPLELAGSDVAPIAPLITNKAGILRLFVAPGPNFVARQLSATLSFSGVNGALVSTKLIRAASANADFTTSFNFPIDASSVLDGASYSLTLQDGASGPELGRYPAAGTSTLHTVSAGSTLNVVVVPINVRGVAANVTADILATFRARVLSMYPLADFTLTLHAPVDSDVALAPNQGWDQTLDGLYALRAQDAPADNVYYYGMFTPTARFNDYCTASCTVGLSQVAGPDEVEYRGSIGLGIFPDGSDNDAPDTMAHELGHALGRRHAPCMTTDPGPFPYPDGKIGAWGFDSLNHLLLDPSLYGDVMGYCTPDWISDFTYNAIFTRIQYVNGAVQAERLSLSAEPPAAFRRVLVDESGALRWGSRFTPGHSLRGDARGVDLLAADGSAVASTSGYFQPFADAVGGFLVLPETALDGAAGVVAIRVGSAELSLSAPMP